MRSARARLGRRAEAEGGATRDQRRPRIGLRHCQRRIDSGKIHAVTRHDVPAGGIETLRHVFRRRQRRRTVDRDAIGIPQDVEPPELEVPGKPDGFLRDAFHQAAVAGDDPGAMIDEIVAEHGVEMALRHCHADRHGQPLPQRPGGGFDTGELEIFRVAGAWAAKLAEVADVVDRRARIPGQVEQRVYQHRAMARRQDEAIAVGPVGVAGVELQMAGEQCRCGVGHPHRHAGMPRIGGLHRIHSQSADGIGHDTGAGHARG